ncbi:MAG: hypothetical protein DMF61_22245 [Blastocatellia bacterium AA13]|nr:MAG: hypothetical protein DMF61_22245 [Blastocatellia bacterium AA13]
MGRKKGTSKSASTALRTKIIEGTQARLPQSEIARQLRCSPQYVSSVIKEAKKNSERFVDVSETMAEFRKLGWKIVDIYDKLATETKFSNGKVSLRTLGKWARGEAKASKTRAETLKDALTHVRNLEGYVQAPRSRKGLPLLNPLKKKAAH